MAAEWWFYHLERSPLEQAAPPLLEKCLEKGWRVLVICPDPDRRENLDRALWTYADESFLPHATLGADGCDPEQQLVLLSEDNQNANAAKAVLLLAGAEIPIDASYERCMVMFDGNDDHARSVARKQFKSAKELGVSPRYFQQTGSGGWKET